MILRPDGQWNWAHEDCLRHAMSLNIAALIFHVNSRTHLRGSNVPNPEGGTSCDGLQASLSQEKNERGKIVTSLRETILGLRRAGDVEGRLKTELIQQHESLASAHAAQVMHSSWNTGPHRSHQSSCRLGACLH